MEIGLPGPADPEPPDTADTADTADTVGDDRGADGRAGHERSRDKRAGDPAPCRFALVVQDDPAGTIVAVTGELDLLSAPQLRAAVDALVGANPRHIAIDLTATTFMDSAGVHALVDARERTGGHLAVICAGGPVLQVIALLGLTAPLNVVPSLAEYRSRRAGG
jgi:anti-sigma B factor antagonist